jgi:hypothetical protein
MTLRPVNNPAAGVAQRTRTGRHFSGMIRRDLAFVHLHRPVKAAYLKAIVRAALEHDPEKRVPVFFNIGHFPNVFSYLSLSQIQSCWQLTENRAMLVPDARFVSTDLWDCQRRVAVASCA